MEHMSMKAPIQPHFSSLFNQRTTHIMTVITNVRDAFHGQFAGTFLQMDSSFINTSHEWCFSVKTLIDHIHS